MGFFGDPQTLISIPGIFDGDFSFWARSKNPSVILNPGDGDQGFRIPQNPQSWGLGFGIFEAEKSPKNLRYRGLGIFYPRDFLEMGIFRGWGFFSLGGISHQKASSI